MDPENASSNSIGGNSSFKLAEPKAVGNRWPRATGHIGEQRLESSEEEGRRRPWKRSRRGPSEMARARWILRRVSHGSSLSLRYYLLSLAFYLLFLPFPTSCFPRTCFLATLLSTDQVSLYTRDISRYALDENSFSSSYNSSILASIIITLLSFSFFPNNWSHLST